MSLISQRFNSRGFGLSYVVGCLGVILAVIWAYWPGLGGPFVLDDFGSIVALGHRGGVVDWETFKAFVFGGNSGPTGRPLSLLTFLIDANNWPSEAWPFKRTNLAIHCLCGIFLALLTRQILLVLRFERSDACWLSIVAAGIWLLHPFLVSTTLYVVQRMAQLSTLLTLAGLSLYLRGRVLLPNNAKRAYILMTMSVGLFTVLATLSKENGVLLPLLVAVTEFTIVANQRETLGHLNRYWSILFLMLPAIALVVYLGSQVFRSDFFDVVPPREFSLYERALTQPRILFDYLQQWFIPKLYSSGVFHDHFVKSTGLLSPISTVLSILGHISIFALALWKRSRWPLFAFAALFFYTSHLLESTVVNLELYFEHRNYLATGFLALPLLVALHHKVSRSQFLVLALAVLILLGSFTRYSSSIWASWPAMVEASALKAPGSERAQAQFSVLLFDAGRYADSLDVLDRAITAIPGSNALLKVNRLVSLCQSNQLSPEEFDKEARELSQLPYDARLMRVYTALANSVATDKCPRVTSAQLTTLFTRMLSVPFNMDRQSLQYSQIQYLIGFSYANTGRSQDAVAAFDESITARPGASHAMQMAAVLASNNNGAEALRFSDMALAMLADPESSVLGVAPVSESDIRIFQETVRADIKASKDADMNRVEQ